MKLFGFTLLRNAIKYDYCYIESIKSLSNITENITISLGKSDDETEASLSEFKNLEIIKTIWDENIR